MLSRTLYLWLMIGVIAPFVASADQLISDNLIVSGASDGTAPAYNCDAGATLPFFPFDPSSVTGTIPVGDPLISEPLPLISTCDFSSGVPPFMCEYTCETPTSAVCVGFDCVDGDSFAEGELRLEENNLRIRFDNTSIDPTLLGRSWSVEANSIRNHGASYFDFELKSLEAGTVHLVTAKDGEQPRYDCSVLVNPITFFQDLDDLIIGIIPVGEPLTFPQIVQSSCAGAPFLCEIECAEIIDFEEKSVLILGPASADPVLGGGVAVGYESAGESGVVSGGRADLVRRIAHLAAGIGGTDALSLANFDLLRQQIADVNVQLDAIEAEIVILEAENQVIDELEESIEAITDLEPGLVTTRGNQNALLNFLSQAVVAIQAGDFAEAVNKLEKALARTDGCALRSSPDGNGKGRDWITDCDAQFEIYVDLNAVLDALTS